MVFPAIASLYFTYKGIMQDISWTKQGFCLHLSYGHSQYKFFQFTAQETERHIPAPHTSGKHNSGCLIEEAQCSTPGLFPLLASPKLQPNTELHGQFVDLWRKHAGWPYRCFNSGINLIIHGLTDSSELSFAACAGLPFWVCTHKQMDELPNYCSIDAPQG